MGVLALSTTTDVSEIVVDDNSKSIDVLAQYDNRGKRKSLDVQKIELLSEIRDLLKNLSEAK